MNLLLSPADAHSASGSLDVLLDAVTPGMSPSILHSLADPLGGSTTGFSLLSAFFPPVGLSPLVASSPPSSPGSIRDPLAVISASTAAKHRDQRSSSAISSIAHVGMSSRTFRERTLDLVEALLLEAHSHARLSSRLSPGQTDAVTRWLASTAKHDDPHLRSRALLTLGGLMRRSADFQAGAAPLGPLRGEAPPDPVSNGVTTESGVAPSCALEEAEGDAQGDAQSDGRGRDWEETGDLEAAARFEPGTSERRDPRVPAGPPSWVASTTASWPGIVRHSSEVASRGGIAAVVAGCLCVLAAVLESGLSDQCALPHRRHRAEILADGIESATGQGAQRGERGAREATDRWNGETRKGDEKENAADGHSQEDSKRKSRLQDSRMAAGSPASESAAAGRKSEAHTHAHTERCSTASAGRHWTGQHAEGEAERRQHGTGAIGAHAAAVLSNAELWDTVSALSSSACGLPIDALREVAGLLSLASRVDDRKGWECAGGGEGISGMCSALVWHCDCWRGVSGSGGVPHVAAVLQAGSQLAHLVWAVGETARGGLERRGALRTAGETMERVVAWSAPEVADAMRRCSAPESCLHSLSSFVEESSECLSVSGHLDCLPVSG